MPPRKVSRDALRVRQAVEDEFKKQFGQAFNEESFAQVYIRRQHPTKRFFCGVEDCSSEFTTAGLLARHLETHLLLSCPCSFKSSSVRTFRDHLAKCALFCARVQGNAAQFQACLSAARAARDELEEEARRSETFDGDGGDSVFVDDEDLVGDLSNEGEAGSADRGVVARHVGADAPSHPKRTPPPRARSRSPSSRRRRTSSSPKRGNGDRFVSEAEPALFPVRRLHAEVRVVRSREFAARCSSSDEESGDDLSRRFRTLALDRRRAPASSEGNTEGESDADEPTSATEDEEYDSDEEIEQERELRLQDVGLENLRLDDSSLVGPDGDEEQAPSRGRPRHCDWHIWVESTAAREAWAYCQKIRSKDRNAFVKWLHRLTPEMANKIPPSYYYLDKLASEWWKLIEDEDIEEFEISVQEDNGQTLKLKAKARKFSDLVNEMLRKLDFATSYFSFSDAARDTSHPAGSYAWYQREYELRHDYAPPHMKRALIAMIKLFADEFERMTKREGHDWGWYLNLANAVGKDEWFLWMILPIPKLVSHTTSRRIFNEIVRKLIIPAFEAGARGTLGAEIRVPGVDNPEPVLVALLSDVQDDNGSRLGAGFMMANSGTCSRRGVRKKEMFLSTPASDVHAFARTRIYKPKVLYDYVATLDTPAKRKSFLQIFGLDPERPAWYEIPLMENPVPTTCTLHQDNLGQYQRDQLVPAGYILEKHIDLLNSITRALTSSVWAFHKVSSPWKVDRVLSSVLVKMGRLTGERAFNVAGVQEYAAAILLEAVDADLISIPPERIQAILDAFRSHLDFSVLIRDYVTPTGIPNYTMLTDAETDWSALDMKASEFRDAHREFHRCQNRIAIVKKDLADLPSLLQAATVGNLAPACEDGEDEDGGGGRDDESSGVGLGAAGARRRHFPEKQYARWNSLPGKTSQARARMSLSNLQAWQSGLQQEVEELQSDLPGMYNDMLDTAAELLTLHTSSAPPLNAETSHALVLAIHTIDADDTRSLPEPFMQRLKLDDAPSWMNVFCSRHAEFAKHHGSLQQAASDSVKETTCDSCSESVTQAFIKVPNGRQKLCSSCKVSASQRAPTAVWKKLDYSAARAGSACENPNFDAQAWHAFLSHHFRSVNFGHTGKGESGHMTYRGVTQQSTNQRNVGRDTLIQNQKRLVSEEVRSDVAAGQQDAEKPEDKRGHGDTCGARQPWSTTFRSDRRHEEEIDFRNIKEMCEKAIMYHADKTWKFKEVVQNATFRPVSGLWLRGRQATLKTRQLVVLELSIDEVRHYIEPVRFVDSRQKGEGALTWAVGYQLVETLADRGIRKYAPNFPVLERTRLKLLWAVPVVGTNVEVVDAVPVHPRLRVARDPASPQLLLERDPKQLIVNPRVPETYPLASTAKIASRGLLKLARDLGTTLSHFYAATHQKHPELDTSELELAPLPSVRGNDGDRFDNDPGRFYDIINSDRENSVSDSAEQGGRPIVVTRG